MIGTAPRTVTVSTTSPTSRERATVVVVPASTLTKRSTRLKPEATATTSYVPGGSAGALKTPSGEVVAFRDCPVSRLTALNCTPGSAAPDESLTKPAIVPVGAWAWPQPGVSNTNRMADGR